MTVLLLAIAKSSFDGYVDFQAQQRSQLLLEATHRVRVR